MGNVGQYYLAEENSWGAWEGRGRFTCFTFSANFPGSLPGLVLWALVCCVFVLFGFCFRGNLFSFFTHSSCWPTMSRTSTAMQEKKRKKKEAARENERPTRVWEWRLRLQSCWLPYIHQLDWLCNNLCCSSSSFVPSFFVVLICCDSLLFLFVVILCCCCCCSLVRAHFFRRTPQWKSGVYVHFLRWACGFVHLEAGVVFAHVLCTEWYIAWYTHFIHVQRFGTYFTHAQT